MPSKILKFLLAASLPMFATDDDSAGAANASDSTEAASGGDSSAGADSAGNVAAGGASADEQSTAETSALDALGSDEGAESGEIDAASAAAAPSDTSATTSAVDAVSGATQDAGEQGNADGSASTAESNTTITEPESRSASDVGTKVTPATIPVSSSDLGPDAQEAGTAESGEGVASLAASGSASDTSSSVSTASQDGGTAADSLTGSGLGDSTAVSLHSIFGEIEAELSRPTGIVATKIRAIIARGRALL